MLQLARMAEQKDILELLKDLSSKQSVKENMLLLKRKLLLDEQSKSRDKLLAEVDARQSQQVEASLDEELRKFDMTMWNEMKIMWKQQQIALQQANVPLIRVTDDQTEWVLQKKVVDILWEMMVN
ncbi:hypothetical protein HK101_006211 [Irineochytrium annulatum]|nr:hypothetical protein HK101_006211 [Irineochytrium annulatum]